MPRYAPFGPRFVGGGCSKARCPSPGAQASRARAQAGPACVQAPLTRSQDSNGKAPSEGQEEVTGAAAEMVECS